MNLYKLHSDPKSLDLHDEAHKSVPKLVWEKYKNNHGELKKREHLWAKDTELSNLYAAIVLQAPFKLGEPAIAKDGLHSFHYAVYPLEGPFKLGEPAIAKDAQLSYLYAKDVLNGPFKRGEDIITKTARFAYLYAKYIFDLPEDEAKIWPKNNSNS